MHTAANDYSFSNVVIAKVLHINVFLCEANFRITLGSVEFTITEKVGGHVVRVLHEIIVFLSRGCLSQGHTFGLLAVFFGNTAFGFTLLSLFVLFRLFLLVSLVLLLRSSSFKVRVELVAWAFSASSAIQAPSTNIEQGWAP